MWYSKFKFWNIILSSIYIISYVWSISGGVGLAIIELVKSKKDVTIYGTASSAKRNFLESKGVHFVEYSEVAALEENFDLIIESMNTETRKVLTTKLNPFGRVVIIGAKGMIPGSNAAETSADPNINPVDLIYGNTAIAGLHIGLLADNYPQLTRIALNSIFTQLTPENLEIKIYPFNDAKRAYKELANRTNIGKIILQIWVHV